MNGAPFPLPGLAPAEVVARPNGHGRGHWAGAPAVAAHPDGGFVIAYRVRNGSHADAAAAGSADANPADENVIAYSPDGVHLDERARFPATRFALRLDDGAAIPASWVERPAIVHLDLGWRLYVCWGGPETKRWQIGVMDAPTLDAFADVPVRETLDLDLMTAVKDPIVLRDADSWRAWVCCHPLDEPGAEDRMSSASATSADGISWTYHGTVLAGTPGHWDERGARLTAVLPDGRAAYDGRKTAEENWFERTGLAHLEGDIYRAAGGPVADVRYLTIAELPGGDHRIWYEARLPDETHELRTELVPAF